MVASLPCDDPGPEPRFVGRATALPYAPDVDSTCVRPALPVDVASSLGASRRGRHDPAMWVSELEVWRATRTPCGPATMRASHADRAGAIRVEAWGPGAPWIIDHAADIVGANDDLTGFGPTTGVVADGHRRFPGLRVTRTRAVVETLLPTILGQKVKAIDAHRSWRLLCHHLGEAAPGPAGARGLLLPPHPPAVAALPSWAMHRFGIEAKRADALRAVAAVAPQLDALADLPLSQGYERLRSIPGIGPWTSAEVGIVALGDPDAVAVGDFHMPNWAAWNLAGEPRGDDQRMLELLDRWPGHRGRALRLVMRAGSKPPAYGPRLARQDLRAFTRM